MKVRSWLSICSSTTATSIEESPKTLLSDTTAAITTSFFDSNTQFSSSSSIHTNISLLTLPSVPSLQKLTFCPQNSLDSSTTASAVLITSIKHQNNGAAANCINFLAVHNNFLYAASGNEINVYETINNTLFTTFSTQNLETGSIKSIAFSDGKIFTAHQDCKIRVWKLNLQKKHQLIATLPTLEDRFSRIFLPQNYVKIRRNRKKLWIEHHDAVSGLAVTDRDSVLSISWDKSIKIWRVHGLKCLESVKVAHDDAINAVVLSKDGLIYTGSADKRIKVWRKEAGSRHELVATLEKHKSAVNALALNHDESILFSGSYDRSIIVWEREDSANHMAVAGALRGHTKAVLCLINVQDLLLSGSADRTVRIWRRGFDGRYCCLNVLEGHQTPVKSLAADDDGRTVFSGSFDGEIRVWRVDVSIDSNYDE